MKKVKSLTLTPFLYGFTMVELIFVIVVIGILSYVGSGYMPNNRLSNDTKFLLLKIRETQKNAIGYDGANFGENPWSSKEENTTCIDLNTTILEQEDRDRNEQKPHRFSSDLNVSGNNRLCFDEYGRPYQEGRLLLQNLDMNLTYKAEYRTISVLPMSGYVIIKY
jgi:prepilin-type N-terminal cleavage/methylation domain-containing protein